MTGSSDGTVRLWDAAKQGDALRTLQHDSRVNCVPSTPMAPVSCRWHRQHRASLGSQHRRNPVHPRGPHRGNHLRRLQPGQSRIVTGSIDFTTRLGTPPTASNSPHSRAIPTKSPGCIQPGRQTHRHRLADRTARIWKLRRGAPATTWQHRTGFPMQRYNLWSHKRQHD